MTQKRIYTEEDYYNSPEDIRIELIDGQIYYQAAPSRIHQEILMELSTTIRDYIRTKKGSCKVYPAPFAVNLSTNSEKSIVEPDISVICDHSKLTDRGCSGAPDWIIEIVSPSTERMDYGVKLFKYRSAGVREYWIINPVNRMVNIYDFENNEKTGQYSFDKNIGSCIYDNLNIRIADLLL